MEDEITEADAANIIPEYVRQAYNDEAHYIARRVEYINRKSWVQQALTFVPYIDAVFEENDIGVAAACSDVNPAYRATIVIAKIEAGLGWPLDDETKADITNDMYDIYNGRPIVP